jgi:hypothetical protein
VLVERAREEEEEKILGGIGQCQTVSSWKQLLASQGTALPSPRGAEATEQHTMPDETAWPFCRVTRGSCYHGKEETQHPLIVIDQQYLLSSMTF